MKEFAEDSHVHRGGPGELFELARFVCQVRRGEALALRERLDYAATPAAQAASAALLGAWLMHHADVPAYRRNR